MSHHGWEGNDLADARETIDALRTDNERLRARLTAAGTSLHDTRTFPAMSEELSRLHAELEQLRAAVCRREEMLSDQRTASSNRIETATALVSRWAQFDFDCPEEEDGAEDGAALERLHEDTFSFLKDRT